MFSETQSAAEARQANLAKMFSITNLKYMQFQTKVEVTADDTCIIKGVISLWQEVSELSDALGDVLVQS